MSYGFWNWLDRGTSILTALLAIVDGYCVPLWCTIGLSKNRFVDEDLGYFLITAAATFLLNSET